MIIVLASQFHIYLPWVNDDGKALVGLRSSDYDYEPSCGPPFEALMTVCVSWMSFWLDHKSAPARVALTITTLLAMATTTSSINASMPPVSYIKVTSPLLHKMYTESQKVI